MPELLWEIGCEELPATFVAPTLAQMEKLFADKFAVARLFSPGPSPSGGGVGEGSLRTYGTPRRLVLHVTGIAERQSDETVTVKGPSEAVAFANGQPTKAALGFAAKNKIAAEDLQIVDGYVQATITREGRSTVELAADLLPQIARELTFPKAMRWGANKLRFARPIRWIVALLDDDVIPFAIEHVQTGRTTRGHRFLSPNDADVPSAKSYFELMRQKSVLIDPNERREMIVSQAQSLAKEAGGQVQIAEELLDENVFLTEYPTAVLGGFDPAYLALPRPVLVTAMRKHQRYFPLNGPDGALLPNFIAVRNGGGEYLDTVRAGFENVLSARFNDAKFFHDLDTQTPLSAKVDRTKTIVFQEKLGSVYQKALRLQVMLEPSGLLSNLSEDDAQNLKRAAALCKADLASEMVKELPALQGVVGEEYARRDGEPEAVARAISAHYMPKGAGDPLPASETGRLLAIADRLDTLTGYMGIGIVPTGTSDPFALRRAASGLVALLATSPSLPALRTLFQAAWHAYGVQEIALTEDIASAYIALRTLIAQRQDAALEEKGVRYDVREAVLATDFTHIYEAQARALALNALIDVPDGKGALAAATRIGNILRFARREGIVLSNNNPDPGLFEDDAERTLWTGWRAIAESYVEALSRGDYPTALRLLAGLRPASDAFFDAVMVMGDDAAHRDNRLALLARLHDGFVRFADWDKIVTNA